MSYNHTYAQIKDILKSSKKMTKEKMLKIASLAIIETVGSEMPEGTEITWDSKLADDLMLDSLAMVELVMFLEECFGIEIPDEEAGNIVTVGDAIEVIKKCKANKGKRKTVSAASLKQKQTVVPHPDSPFRAKPPGQYIGTNVASKETQEALERLHDDIRESKDNTELS
jgi:acyl carrier protein